jgi:predicted permease
MAGIRPGIRWLLRLALRREYLTRADVDREIAFHIDARTAQLKAAGLGPSDARAEALARFGDVEQARALLTAGALEQDKRIAARERLENLMDDIRYVFRALGKSRAFSASVILALALGLGANAAMFGIIDRLLLSGPEHVASPQRLHRLYGNTVNARGQSVATPDFGYVTYAFLRDYARGFEGVAAYSDISHNVGTGAQSEQADGYMVTHDFFGLLGVRPAFGRFFTKEEDLPPLGQKVVVLDYGLWQRHFAGDTGIVGSTVLLTGEPYTVVGVTPRGFTGVELRRAGFWVPMALSRTRVDWPTTWQAQWLKIVARVKPGVSLSQASAEAERLFRQNYVGRDNSFANKKQFSLRPIAFTDTGREPPEFAVSRWLIGVSLMVLLIAWANVTHLMLARATRRQREVAVRLTLGIGRLRLARLLTLEGVVLALAGCSLGLVFAHWGGQVIRSVFLPEVNWTSAPINARVVLATVTMALIVGALVGLAPVLHSRRLDLSHALKSASQQAGTSRSRLRPLLMFAQATFSFLLLVGAGLFIRSVHRVTSLDHGFEPQRALRAVISWRSVRRTQEEAAVERARRRSVHAAVTRRLRATPGVEHAAIAVGTPFGNAFGVDLWVPGRDSIPDLGSGPFVNAVEHDYFEAAGMRLRRGRLFTAADNDQSERVVIINETMARTLWPSEDPLSKCLQIFTKELPCARVVGVITDPRRFGLTESPAMQYYVPFGQERGFGGSAIVVRPSGDPRQFMATLRRIILEVDPNVLSTRIMTMQEAIDPLTRSWRLGATLFTIFGALALAIAGIGLYSVIAYLVAQRTQEFGVRMALGARSDDIVRLVLRHGLVTVAAGLVAGVVVALLASRAVEPLLFQTSPRDVTVFALAVVTLFGAALLACFLPALRASRVDAATALRAE